MSPTHAAQALAITLCACALSLGGCLGGNLSRSEGLTPHAVVASNGEDAFNFAAQGGLREQPKPSLSTLSQPTTSVANTTPTIAAVTVSPDPDADGAFALHIDVHPEVRALSVAALSVSGGEAAVFWQGGTLRSPDTIRRLWTRSAASPQRLSLPLAALWPTAGPRGVIALTLEADLPDQPTQTHRQLISAAPFSVTAHRDGAALYAQIQHPPNGLAPYAVEVIDDQGRTVAQGRASAEGALKLSHPAFNAASSAFLVIARRGDERAFTTVQP
jgi:hypothetical protein